MTSAPIRDGGFSFKVRSIIRFCSLTATCIILSPAAAEESPEEASIVTTEEVVISATRTVGPVSQSASAVTVLTREHIERSPYAGGHQLDDLIRSVPGVQPATLSSRYNHPTAQSVTLNGPVRSRHSAARF
jgi:outer membrane receptor for ferrienterochelin and colicin